MQARIEKLNFKSRLIVMPETTTEYYAMMKWLEEFRVFSEDCTVEKDSSLMEE
jgi:hypothetical protein